MRNKLAKLAVMMMTVMATMFLAACGNDLSAEKAEEMIAGFKTEPTTVSGTWVQDFKLAVNSDNTSFKAFEQDIKATVEFAMDLTAGNLYYYAKRTTDTGITYEEIVAQDGGKYYYKNSSQNPVELASEAAALEKINSAFKAVTTEKAGWLDTKAFLYDSTWVADYIELGSTNVPTNNKNYFTYTYSKTEDGGLQVDLDAKYVGYTGDSGIVDVGTNDTMTGSKVIVSTNKSGHVLSLEQSMNNYIEFNISNPPVPLLYTGTRSLTASYDAVTRKTLADVEMTATAGTVSVTAGRGASYELFDFDYATMGFAATKSEILPGHFIAIKVTCADGTEVDAVTVNGEATQNMNGYYCYMTPVAAGNSYTAEITTKSTGDGPVVTTGTVTVNANGIGYELYDFDYSTFAFVPTESEVAEGHFIALKLTSLNIVDGTEATVTVDGNAATYLNGYYCYMKSVVAGMSYAVEITEGGAAAGGETTGGEEAPAAGTVTVVADAGITYELYDFDVATQQPVPTESEVAAGHYIAVKVTGGEGTVTVNGEATKSMGSFLCYMTAVEAGKAYEVKITANAAGGEEAPAATAGAVTVAADAGITYELYDFDVATFAFAATESEVAAGHYIAVKITAGDATVTVNGNATVPQGGYLCYMTAVEAGKSYEVKITSNAATVEGNVTVAAEEGLAYTLYDFDYATMGFAVTENVVAEGHFIAVKFAEGTDGVVTVNGEATQNMNGYYCYMKAVEAGKTYEVKITK